jgi:hypothetical protein
MSMQLDESRLLMAPAAVRSRLASAKEAHLKLARQYPNAFMTYVLKDEETGKPILQSPIHQEWNWLFSGDVSRLLIWSHVEAGKTTQMSIGRVLFELGKNPNLRVVVCSNTGGQAQKICMMIAKYIEQSEELHEVFPHLKKARGLPWNQNQLYVQRETKAKDPSVQTLGIHGNILGSRIDLLIMDDLLDYENTVSPTQREDLWAWYHATLEGRLTRRSRVLCIGTAWHREDIMHRFAKNPGWVAVRYPVVDGDGKSRWPDRWPDDRIAQKREALGPLEFSRQFLCIARSDEDARFKKEWIDQCLKRGLGKTLIHALERVPDGYKTYTGVDLGVRVKAGSDLTSIFTIAVAPNGDRQVLDIQAGRWAGPDIVRRLVDTHNRYGSIVIVENNAAQQFIVDFTKEMSAVPVKSFTTTGRAISHAEFGIEGLATELANGKWIIPSVEINGRYRAASPDLDAWVNELLYYDPAGHPGDRLMSSWFAREGARMAKPKIQFGRLNTTVR